MGPKRIVLTSQDWWFKSIEMFCHNWALIEEKGKSRFVIYFFHDLNSSVIDSLTFKSLEECQTALRYNHFQLHSENPGPWDEFKPVGKFVDGRRTSRRVYSEGGFWKEPPNEKRLLRVRLEVEQKEIERRIQIVSDELKKLRTARASLKDRLRKLMSLETETFRVRSRTLKSNS